ncbi:S-layer homology domain-containing protein [Paenibacillus sacheonensis]|uniref:SLH domain-containing protein n=1 Tax=Paenibacillus sacheonensis TaxID=742054 RepID=A0A7X4YJS6_9BACL|nr:S-layer homology domain-containing protein [Paenibacillus sacheonensis]MBM7564083.1 hypothetical protein [Paenibacillus sacheonensis]NBC67588.1 hypothetical protein [Paenibacillus sacheonensis]
MNPSVTPSPAELQRTLRRLLDSSPKVTFPDVRPSDWSAAGIAIASQLGIAAGMPDGQFHGNANVTRVEFAAMTARALHLVTPVTAGNHPFTDTKGHWAEGMIAALEHAGVVNGKGNGLFMPDRPISRAEIAAILARVMKMTPAPTTNSFSDISNSRAKSYIEQLHAAGIVGR